MNKAPKFGQHFREKLMNWKKVVAAAPLLFALTSLPASAVVFEFNTEFSGSGGTCANTTCATLTVTQDGSDVDFVLQADLDTGEKITGIFGNQDPYSLGTNNAGGTSQIVDIGGTTTATATPDTGLNEFKADGDGNFDWVIDISTADPGMDNSDTLTWTITNTALNDIILALSESTGGESGPFTFALRVQGLGPDNQNSGWFFADIQQEPPQLAEPGMLALLGMALFMLGFVHRRRSSIG